MSSRILGKGLLLTFICIAALCRFTLAQSKITGNVSNEAGDPLIGVSVIVQGTSSGTVTNVDGNFQLEVPSEESVLEFSYVGYTEQQVTVGTQSSLTITMMESTSLLDEVVVVGYGTQEKEDVTGAISSVKGADFQNLPVTGASQALQGRAAGLEVVNSNGGAPGEGGSIRIRGTGTVNNANPLIIIDGVPVQNADINDINPNDIQSIEVLKDAASAAIYGQRAANGVILVTTKGGGFNEKLSITLNAYAGVSNSINTVDVLNAAQLTEVKTEAYTNDGLDVPEIWTDNYFQTNRTNWQEELLGTGAYQNIDFSITGGSEKASFAFSGGYFNEEGMIKNTFADRMYGRINTQFKVTNWLTIGENLQLTRKTQQGVGTNSAQSGIIWSAIRFHPGLPVIYDQNLPNPKYGIEEGDYGSSQISGEFGDINNPIFEADVVDDLRTNLRALGNVFAEIQFTEALKFRANFGVDASIFDRDRFGVIIDKQIRARDRNELDRSYNEAYSLLGEYFLTYDETFGSHHINVVGGYTAQQFVSEGFEARGRDFPSEEESQRFLNQATDLRDLSGTKSEDALVSGFARLNYSYDDKYYLSGTFRADGSSKFAEGNKWGYFPAVSAGWRISREPFLADNNLISFLKLTASWGQLGNQEVAGLQYLALINSGRRYSFNGEQVVGSSQGRIPNPNISWETAEITNIGLDLGFMNNQLLANINYFIKDTKDMLLAPPTVATIGRADMSQIKTWVKSETKGLELELGYRSGSASDFYVQHQCQCSFHPK